MRRIHFIACSLFSFSLVPFSVFAGDPVPGIGITVEQSPNGVVGTGTTNNAGEFTLSNLSAGDYQISLSGNGQTVVLGKQREDRITIASGRSATIKPIRLELSRYQNGDDVILRKRPGRTTASAGGSSSTSTRATDYNSSRSNRTISPSDALDTDDDGDSVPTLASAAGSAGTSTRAADYNSSRSNRTTASGRNLDDDDSIPTQVRGTQQAPNAVDNDCGGIAEIITTADSLTVRISCDND